MHDAAPLFKIDPAAASPSESRELMLTTYS